MYALEDSLGVFLKDLFSSLFKYQIKTIWLPYGNFSFSYFFKSLHFVIWILRLINSMIELIDFMMQQFLLGLILNMLFCYILTQKLIILGILSKFNLSIKELNSLSSPVYL